MLNSNMTMQGALRTATMAMALACAALSQQGDPWQKSEFMQPAELAAILQSKSGKPPLVICTAFPVLYRSRHILGAKYAGPGGKPEGIEMLKKTVEEIGRA